MTTSTLTLPRETNTQIDQQRKQEKAAYERDGYVVVPQIISAQKLAEVRNMIDQAMAGTIKPDRVAKPDFKIQYEPGVKDDPNTSRTEKIRIMFDLCHTHQFFWDLATCPEILDAVENLIGPNINLYTDQMFAKPARHGSEVPYHQDSAYWPKAEPRLLSCWLAIDDVTIENGCVRFIPGTHKTVIPHFNDKTRKTNPIGIKPEQVQSEQEIPVEMKAGSASFHHSLAVHRSFPNNSNRSRRGLVIIYMPADLKFNDQWDFEYGFPAVRRK
jgi:phytanoyl-CoA hydroxylase